MRAAMEPAAVGEETLMQWVRQHQVTWEVSPQREMIDGGSLQVVGYEVRVYGLVPCEGDTPGGADCRATYERVRAIAQAALPADGGNTRCQVESFDSSLHMRPDSEWRPEVEVSIHLTHRRAYAVPPDASEKRVAQAIETRLKQLGAQPGRWTKAG
jgi:hypothetical protein